MPAEENIINELTKKFGYLTGKAKVSRPRRISVDVDMSKFAEVFDYAVKELGFALLCTITGLDEGDNIVLIYHVAQQGGTVLNIKTGVPKQDAGIKTITHYFPSAEIYEREIVDLLGVKVEGLQRGNRYPLTDDWPEGQFPLRKEWKG